MPTVIHRNDTTKTAVVAQLFYAVLGGLLNCFIEVSHTSTDGGRSGKANEILAMLK